PTSPTSLPHPLSLHDALPISLTPEDFKLPGIALHPDTEIQKGDTLFSKEELNSWTTQLSEYNQLKWDEDLFSDTVRFISKNEIPDRKSTRLNSSHVSISYAVF